ncbi:MAG: dTDP-4-dehydrorhamnose reductase [Chitinophagales bacterium]|nr:dTDP-4-dehydrorhamnose reductase [Chitinophagales bacterium]
MTRILITGANGQLGNELKDLAKGIPSLELTLTDHQELDITNYSAIEQFLDGQQYEYCINCAAYTAVDKAESEQELAYKINAEAVGLLAKATAQHGVKFVHISTDFVFNGKQASPYKEEDNTEPLNAYGHTKLKGEELCQKYNPDSIIIRTAWLYSAYGNNFVKTMRRLGAERKSLNVIYDQVGTPTYANDLAAAILHLITEKKGSIAAGIYHYSNEGVASWYDFAAAIMELSHLQCKVKPINTYEYPTPATRPAFSILDKRKIKTALGIEVPYWRESLKRCIAELSKNA